MTDAVQDRGTPSMSSGGIAASRLSSPGWRWLWLALLLLAPALIPALTQDIGAQAYDAATEHIYRGVAFSEAISGGDLYPRWSQQLHWGLGSPLFTFQPPLPYYGMDLLARLGIAHPIGWRILIASGLAAAFAGMYLLVRALAGSRPAAFVAAAAYLYAPYLLRNALERGSNEAFSVFLYPAVLWSLVQLARRPGAGRFAAATLIWAACIASHVLGPLILAPVALVAALWLGWRHRIVLPLAALVAGGLLTAAIWLPIVQEQAWVHVERDFKQPEARPAENPLPLDRLLALPAVFDTGRANNNVGDRVGVIHTAGLVAGLAGGLVAWARGRRGRTGGVTTTGQARGPAPTVGLIAVSAGGLVLLWLLTAGSDPLWRALEPILGRLLYRTRLMGVQAMAAALAAGLLVALLAKRRQHAPAAILAAVFVLTALPALYVGLQPRYTTFSLPVDLAQVRAEEVRQGGKALTAYGEFEPKWRTRKFDAAFLAELGASFDAAQAPLAGSPSGVTLESSRVVNSVWDLRITAREASTATLHLLYYPRWQARLDGVPIELRPEPGSGYITVDVPAGTHDLTLRYGSTRAEIAGLILSGLMAVVLAATCVWTTVSRRRGTRVLSAPDATTGAAPPVWVLAVLTLALGSKVFWIDPGTTWLRCTPLPHARATPARPPRPGSWRVLRSPATVCPTGRSLPGAPSGSRCSGGPARPLTGGSGASSTSAAATANNPSTRRPRTASGRRQSIRLPAAS